MGGVSDIASGILWVVSYGLLGYELFRMFSRKIGNRRMENQRFLGIRRKIVKWFKLMYSKIRDMRTHRYFSCPGCKNSLRVPKGRGDVTITCPVCKTKFDRKT